MDKHTEKRFLKGQKTLFIKMYVRVLFKIQVYGTKIIYVSPHSFSTQRYRLFMNKMQRLHSMNASIL